MGLENGIEIKANRHTALIFEESKPRDFKWALEMGFNESEEHEGIKEGIVCYWRKCWGLRDEICNAIHYNGDRGTLLSKEDLKKIWYVINKLNSRKAWNNSNSIWDYSDIRDTLDQQLYNIEYLIFIMSDPLWDGEVYFYDSY